VREGAAASVARSGGALEQNRIVRRAAICSEMARASASKATLVRDVLNDRTKMNYNAQEG